MEIYNENAYDLLDRRHLETPLENWSKVIIMYLSSSLLIIIKYLK